MTSVSVCLPTCEGESFLRLAIESILAQSFEDFELIIVDDCSIDSSFEIAQEYSKKDNRIKSFRNESRLGLFANYNAAINQSKGEFIKPFAQDDILTSNYLDVAINNLESNPEVVLFSSARDWINDKGEDVSSLYQSSFVSDYFSSPGPIAGSEVISKSLSSLVNFIGEPVCATFRRTDPLIGFDEKFLHLGDLDLWLRLLRLGNLAYTNQVLCSFRRHSKNETNKNLESLAIAPDMMLLFKKLSSYRDCSKEYEQEFLNRSIQVISDQYKIVNSNEHEAGLNMLQKLPRRDLEIISNHALSLVNTEDNSAKERFRLACETDRLERKLRICLKDPLWLATRPIREARKLLLNKNQSDSVQLEIGFEQKDYIQHLKQKIIAIKLSKTFFIRNLLAGKEVLDPTGRKKARQSLRTLKRLKSKKCASASVRVSSASLDDLTSEVIMTADESITHPKISVLIGFMRHSPISALTALLNQSVENRDFEVICVDSSGNENNEQELKLWVRKNTSAKNYKIVRTQKAGRSFANNVALRMARSSLVVLLASDFIPPETFVESHLNFHRVKNDKNLIAIGGALFNKGQSNSSFQNWLDQSGTVFGVPFIDATEVPENFFYAANTSFNKKLAFQAGLFDEDFELDAWDDYDLGLRLVKLGSRSQYLPGALCQHEHDVNFLERLKLMNYAAQAAITFDLKNQGNYPWHKNIEKPTSEFAASAFNNLKAHLTTGKQSYLDEFWQTSLDAAFYRSYRKNLAKKWNLNN